jgi:high-affinity iron transporter
MNQWVSGRAIFVVWREALEAILIVGILYSYLCKTDSRGLRPMWIGVLAGIGLSLTLAGLMLWTQGVLEGQRQVYFETAILFLSCGLMTQMVFWMRKHGRFLKREIESDLNRAATTSGFLGIALVSTLSVGREGTEAVIYVYGLCLEKTVSMQAMALSVILGLLLAVGMSWMLARGLHLLKNQLFFQITSIVLLISAAALGTTAVGKLVAENMIPGLIEPVWNTSAWIDSQSFLAGLLKTLLGYNPRPSLSEVLFYLSYWSVVFGYWNREWFRVYRMRLAR